jgi:Ca-activated chloride channel family protein
MKRSTRSILTVVCAVAAVLVGVAILFPVFSQSREMARSQALAPARDQAFAPARSAAAAPADSYASVTETKTGGRDVAAAGASRPVATEQARNPVTLPEAETKGPAGQRSPQMIAGKAAAPPYAAMAKSLAPPPGQTDRYRSTVDPNIYISSSYMGGNGARDRLEKLVTAGVLIDGKRVKLESFARRYAQTFPIPTRTALGVTAETERTRIVQEGDHTYLQVALQSMAGELPRRLPLNVALVIDRSGSMAQDGKLESAKAAAIHLLEQLRPDDVFSLVIFDSQAHLLVPSRRARDMNGVRSQIQRLTPGGGTNIYDGLRRGYAEAATAAGSETINRVILLSDGRVSSGVTDPGAFERLTAMEADKEIQTTSVGVGLDFNEDLMMAIARDGRGNYHFIKDSADTRTVFAKELDELTHVVAKAVRLRIRLAEGIGLVRVLGATTLDADQTRRVKTDERRIDRRVADELGIAADRQTEQDEPGIKLLIPAFFRGDSHIVMLELAVPPGQGRRSVAEVFLKYKDLVTRSNRTETCGVSIDYTRDRAEMITSIRRSVKKNLLGFQTGEALADAGRLISRGQPADAVKRVDERMVVVGLAAREWRDRDLERDGQLLSRYESVLKQISANPQTARTDLGQYVARSLTYNGYKMTR